MSSKEEFEKAMRWYESTLKLQPEFGPAKDRLRTIQCYLLSKKDRRAPWGHNTHTNVTLTCSLILAISEEHGVSLFVVLIS